MDDDPRGEAMTHALDAAVLETPIGPLTLIADADILVAAGFAGPEEMAARLGPPAPRLRTRADLGRLSAAVTAYFAGDLAALDDLPVRQPGAAFRQAAWAALRGVGAGEVVTYAELAARAGRPAAVRAAGGACAHNLIAPIVPCHRVIRTDRGLGGYLYGVERKRWLLAHERGALSVAAS
jgi:methylated-DNA-[protein]-cysteine S-methyltransferase